MPLFQMFGKILSSTKRHTAVKTLRRDEVQDVWVREQVFTSICLDCLIKKALHCKAVPIGSVKHLLSIVELLNVLRQAVACGVSLAAVIALQVSLFSDIAKICSELCFRQQHGQLSPDYTSMILCKRYGAKTTGIASVSMFGVVL